MSTATTTNDRGVEEANASGAASGLPPRETCRPYSTQQTLRSDLIAPPDTLLTTSDYSLGTGPVDVERYISQEFYELEAKRLWPNVWQFAAWAYDIPEPGDYTVYRNLADSILIVRQKNHSIKAFVNSCLHRGRELCQDSGHREQLRCPYHGFTWGTDGNLQWIPAEWDFPQIDRDEFSLPEVQVEQWNGFIFVNMNPEAVPLKQYMGSMVDQWQAWDFSKKYKAVHVEKLINCNWKVCMEGFIEAFHVFASHPQLASVFPESSSQYDIYPDQPHFNRAHFLFGMPSSAIHDQPTQQGMVDSYLAAYLPEFCGTEAAVLREGESARAAFARLARTVYKDRLGLDVSRMPESELIDGTEYLLFPNFTPWPSLANPIVYRFRPGDGPDWCIWDTILLMPFEGPRPPSAKVVKLGPDDNFEDVKELGYLSTIVQQDAEQLPLVQRGLKASKRRVVTLSQYQESRIRHYNQTLDTYLNTPEGPIAGSRR